MYNLLPFAEIALDLEYPIDFNDNPISGGELEDVFMMACDNQIQKLRFHQIKHLRFHQIILKQRIIVL